jgi:hypothetical protein
MASNKADPAPTLEDRIILAVEAYKNSQFKSIRAAAATYDVSRSPLTHQISGRKPRVDVPTNYQKLKDLEEASLKQ